LNLIAGAAEGSVRDGLSLLDQAIAHCGGKVTAAQVREMLGLADRARIYDLFEALMKGDVAGALAHLREQYDLGADPEVIIRDLLELTHLLTRLQVAPEAGADPALSELERLRAEALAGALSMPVLARTWQMLLKGLGEIRGAPSALAAAEMILIRLAYSTDLPSPLDAVRQVTGGGGGGAPDTKAAPTAPVIAAATSAPTGHARARTGGGAAASALSAPQEAPAEAAAEEVAETPIAAPVVPIDSFAAIVARAQVQDVRLYHHLMEDVRLVAFRPGHLEIRPEDKAPSDLASNLRGKLESWTGETWAVVINGQAEGHAPIAVQRRWAEADILASAEGDPLVRAVLETFPGAKVTDVRPLGEDGGPAAPPEPPIPSDEVEQS
jgi:DNA polymerase-3 subunit gamma/tau